MHSRIPVTSKKGIPKERGKESARGGKKGSGRAEGDWTGRSLCPRLKRGFAAEKGAGEEGKYCRGVEGEKDG